jgi:hypothetical protein
LAFLESSARIVPGSLLSSSAPFSPQSFERF